MDITLLLLIFCVEEITSFFNLTSENVSNLGSSLILMVWIEIVYAILKAILELNSQGKDKKE